MKLKTRLIVAFFTIILIPVVLLLVALFGVGKYQLAAIESHYGIEDASYDNLSNSIGILSKFTKNIYSQMNSTAQKEPMLFEDGEYLEGINTDLLVRCSYLVVRKDGELVYKGSDEDISFLEKNLPEYGRKPTDVESGIYVGGNVQSLIRQVDFEYSDGGKGSLFVITEVGKMIPQVKHLIIEIFIAMVLILTFTSGMLTLWIYRGIVTPMRKLKGAAQNIKEGNLDFTLESENCDEIGDLCADFEDMRKRLKESAEEKLEYDKENKELISNISHDLKTPITAIKGYVEGIMDGVADTPEKTNKYIRTIYNKANDMDRLINELTFYTQIDTNRIPYTFNKMKVSSYFDDCVEEVSLELESKNIELAYFNYTEEDVQIIADAEQIRRVINNIISNSIKYNDKKKKFINIRVKDVGDFIQVEIEDNGKGIGKKELPYIFDRFYRTDTSRNSSKGGSGIGLSIVKKIVDDHGGKIWATSKEATGTVVYFVLRKYQEVPADE